LPQFIQYAREKGIQLTLTGDQKLPRVDLDPDRLTQILGNLINNALNVLSSGGNIELSARQDWKKLVLEVIDDGPGISDENQRLIFNRSFRTDKSRSSENNSSGLGLAITKKLVDAQGGEISVASTRGEKTTFRLTFPIT